MLEVSRRLAETLIGFPDLDTPWDLKDAFDNWTGEIALPRRKVDGLETAEVYADETAVIQPHVLFAGKVILCKGARIGPFTFIRGPVFIGPGAMVGPHCEVIRTIVMDRTVLAHKNSIADTIFGTDINFSGLSTCCNFPIGRDYVKIRYRGATHIYNGRFGATIGNGSQLGALTITMPGCEIPENSCIVGQCNVYGECKVKSFSGVSIHNVIGQKGFRRDN